MKISQLLIFANGNMGIMNFLMELGEQPAFMKNPIFEKIQQGNIVGADLYVLYSDICQKNMHKVFVLCSECPTSILVDACSRQDRSGRELVKQYLPK